MTRPSFTLLALWLASGAATHAQSTPTEPPADTSRAAEAWEFDASVYAYFVPDDDDYLSPIVTADRGWLHLEGRYNYEDQDTGSLWVGYNVSGGDELSWEVTPILGAVFGETDGIAPGYEATLAWRKLELYSEGEYVFGDDSADDYFYNWSELSFYALEWLRFGIVTQRTRAYETEREIQRGLLVGFAYEALTVTGYVFNPDDEEATCVLAAGLTF